MTGREVPSMTGRALLLFDADSEFCRTSVRWAARHDRRGRLRSVPIQTPEGQGLLASVPPPDRGHSWHLLLDGQVYSGRDVLDPLFGLLDRPLAGRFLTRAIAGMGRAGQSRPGPGTGAAPPSPAMAPAPEAPVLGNGAPDQEAPSRPDPVRPAAAPVGGDGASAEEAPVLPEATPGPEAAGSPEPTPDAEAPPAVGLMHRPAPVRAPTRGSAAPVEPAP